MCRETQERGLPVWWHLDLRATNWTSLDRYSQVARPALQGASLVLGPEEDFAALLGLPVEAQERLQNGVRALELDLVLLKTGPEGGVLLARDGEPVHLPASAVTPVCTVGGGDALVRGLVAARLDGLPWAKAVSYAMRVAGWTMSRPGCSEGFPTRDQLDRSDVLVAQGA